MKGVVSVLRDEVVIMKSTEQKCKEDLLTKHVATSWTTGAL